MAMDKSERTYLDEASDAVRDIDTCIYALDGWAVAFAITGNDAMAENLDWVIKRLGKAKGHADTCATMAGNQMLGDAQETTGILFNGIVAGMKVATELDEED